MTRRTKRMEMPTDIPNLLRELGACRAAMIRVCTTVTASGQAYHAANRVTEAIDQMAAVLTDDPRYFHLKPHGSQRQQESP